MKPIVAVALLIAPAAAGAQQPAAPTVASLAWLTGEWVGEGREAGKPVEGKARLYWTPPTDGVATYLFSWNDPAKRHVHHAISIFRDGTGGVTGKGIHYGSDFRNFETAPWELRLVSARRGEALFECVAHCRAHLIRFALTGRGRLEERWSQKDKSKPDWIVTYRRAK